MITKIESLPLHPFRNRIYLKIYLHMLPIYCNHNTKMKNHV
uniref:Uncharacterized protein n=1 Tax=Anguilla anguilla TaxID=7936 RepID=A0A0E9S2M6_ANGAN